jgi:hypothetical protein
MGRHRLRQAGRRHPLRDTRSILLPRPQDQRIISTSKLAVSVVLFDRDRRSHHATDLLVRVGRLPHRFKLLADARMQSLLASVMSLSASSGRLAACAAMAWVNRSMATAISGAGSRELGRPTPGAVTSHGRELRHRSRGMGARSGAMSKWCETPTSRAGLII